MYYEVYTTKVKITMQLQTLRHYIRETLTNPSTRLDEFSLLPLIFAQAANAPGPCDDVITYETEKLIAMLIGGTMMLEAAAVAGAAGGLSIWPALARLPSAIRGIMHVSIAAQIISKTYKIIEVNASPIASNKEKHQKTTALLCEMLIDVLIYRLSLSLSNPLSVELEIAKSMTQVGKVLEAIKGVLRASPQFLGWLTKDVLISLPIYELYVNKELIVEYAAEKESGRKMLRAIETMEQLEMAEKMSKAEVDKIRKSLEETRVNEYDIKDMTVDVGDVSIKIGTIKTPTVDCAAKVLTDRAKATGMPAQASPASPSTTARSSNV